MKNRSLVVSVLLGLSLSVSPLAAQEEAAATDDGIGAATAVNPLRTIPHWRGPPARVAPSEPPPSTNSLVDIY